MTSEQIQSMPDEQLLGYLDFSHGIRLPFGTPRSVILSKLNAVAVAARDV